MQWLFDIVEEMMTKAGFIKLPAVELYLKGMILMWSGTGSNVPEGWALCDGTLGTPDLQLRFVLCRWANFTEHLSGGGINHTHDFTGDGHLHDVPIGDDIAGGVALSDRTSSSNVTGTTDIAGVMPPYYVLAFIMKL